MTREQVLQAVRGALKTLLTLPDAQVLVAESPGTIPTGTDAYLTVDVITGATVDRQTVAVASGGGMAKRVSSQRRVRVSINGYGDDAEDWLTTVATAWMSTHPALDAMRTAVLTPGPAGDPRQIREVVGRYPLPRFQLDVIGYNRVVLADASVDSITSVDMTDDIDGETNTYTVEQ